MNSKLAAGKALSSVPISITVRQIDNVRVVDRGHEWLKLHVHAGDTVVDATVGNGSDTLALAELVTASGKVIGFDIQTQAIELARIKLAEVGLQNVEWHSLCHSEMQPYLPQDIAAVTFNLGYLPNSSKTICTQTKSTIEALQISCAKIKQNGIITVVSYVGHDGGEEEDRAIRDLCKSLDPQQFEVTYELLPAQHAPRLTIILKK